MKRKSKIRYKHNPNVKKMWVGGAISAGAGIATTLIQNEQMKENEKRLQKIQFEKELAQREEKDKTVLDTYPVDGVTEDLYASGGDLNKKKNTIPLDNSLELASNAEKVINAGTHESGDDVNVYDNANNIAAKVEDQEVILDGEKVLSNRLGYADVAENISKAKGQVENVLNDPNLKRLDNRERNTLDRVMSPLHKAINNLNKANESNFKAQEDNKTPNVITEDIQTDIPIAADGLDMSKPKIKTDVDGDSEFGFNDVAPYLDNVAGLLRRTPKPIAPVTQDAAQLDTTVDVSQELQDIKDIETATIADIDANTSDSAVAQSRKAAARSTANKQKQQVLSNQRKEEQQLENTQRIQNAQIEARNIAAQEDYQASMLSRDVARGEALQSNIANIVGDIRQSELDKASEARDERAVMAIMAQSATSGSSYQMALSGALDFMSDENKRTMLQQFKNAGRNTTALEGKWDISQL